MKTMKTAGLSGIIAGIAIVMSSFSSPKHTEPATFSAKEENEWSQVYNFIDQKICTAIAENDQEQGKHVKLNYFSRCPSGYQSSIASKDEAVRTENFVYGRIELYSGCTPKYVCNFKVCVDKDLALVKTKGMTEYIPVNEWLDKKDQQRKEQGKKIAKG